MYFKKQKLAKDVLRQRGRMAEPVRANLCDFEGALARLGGDRGLLTELVHIYVEDAPMLLARISNGVREANCSDVLHAAHLLRGLAANLGAPSVTGPAERLEEIAIAGSLQDAPATVRKLRTEAARLEEELQPFCWPPPASSPKR